jgi:membrane associated rhomboid family serine protease
MPDHERQARIPHAAARAWADAVSALPADLPRPPLDIETAGDFALVLQATEVPHRMRRSGFGWTVIVPEHALDEAVHQIESYVRENRGQRESAESEERESFFETGWTTLTVLALGLLFHMVSQGAILEFGLWRISWHELGMADSVRILGGEYWRTVTALTLHADAAHITGNLVIGGIFVHILSREIRSGPAWLLFLLSGALGNLANAWVHGPGHLSVGASTGIFGVVAVLGAMRITTDKRLSIMRAIAPAVAGLALLAMLGTGGERTDLLAHALGFLAGIPLGLAGGRLVAERGRPGDGVNLAASMAAAAMIFFAWARALAQWQPQAGAIF